MAKIVLATLNARYIHSAFGLRYLLANLGDLQQQTRLFEFVINDNTVEMLAAILEEDPEIVGFGVYIWNVEQTTKLIADLKLLRPNIKIIIGGPEVSYEALEQPIAQLADYIVAGEADLEFPKLCNNILSGDAPNEKLIFASLPTLDTIRLPYELYSDEDIANRVLYVELSRGCPFTCEFCLSSLDIPVRTFSLESFLDAMQRLLDRGAKQFKFVDRTFNLNLRLSQSILQFFLDRYHEGMFLHFEMIPDRLPDPLRELIAKFPPGVLQFEIGIQSFNPEVGQLISRKQNVDKLEDNFRYLLNETGVHIHADLIVGLPGESIESFAEGFNRLFALRPQEIQVGILKRLRGTPIIRHDDEWQMIYSPHPPYEILSNKLLSFNDVQRLRRFAKHWDMIGNSGNFVRSLPLICGSGDLPFWQFMQLSEWLYEHNKRLHGISLVRLIELVLQFLIDVRMIVPQQAAQALWDDYSLGGKREKPGFFKRFQLVDPQATSSVKNAAQKLPSRQSKHLSNIANSSGAAQAAR